MVYSYLLDLYKVLDKRKESIESELAELTNDPEKLQFHLGRIAVIMEFKDYLVSHYHAKLPRRLQKIQQ